MMAQELIRPESKEELKDDVVYAVRDENQQLIQVQKQDIKTGQEYIVLPVIKGG